MPDTSGSVKKPLSIAEGLRREQDFLKKVAEEVLGDIRCRRPEPYEYFRINPDPDTQLNAAVFVHEVDRRRTEYLVGEEAVKSAPTKLSFKTIYQWVSWDDEVVGLWAISQLNPDYENAFARSARRGAELAQERWVRIFNKGGKYSIFGPSDDMVAQMADKAPDFKAEHYTYDEMLEKHFGGNKISDWSDSKFAYLVDEEIE